MNNCGDILSSCLKSNNEKRAQIPDVDPSNYTEVVAQITDLHDALHKCSTDKETIVNLARTNGFLVGTDEEEINSIRTLFNTSKYKDPNYDLTNRFMRTTYYDLPARKSKKTYDEWYKIYSSRC